MKKYIIFVIAFCLLSLAFVYLLKSVYSHHLETSLLKSFSSSREGVQFIEKNPDFIKSISKYPEIVIFVKNCVSVTPKFYILFHKYPEVFDDLRTSPRLRKNCLFSSKYPKVVQFWADNFKKLLSFTKEHPDMVEYLQRNLDYAHYLCVDHFDKFEYIMTSPDAGVLAKKVLEEYIVQKYLKAPDGDKLV